LCTEALLTFALVAASAIFADFTKRRRVTLMAPLGAGMYRISLIAPLILSICMVASLAGAQTLQSANAGPSDSSARKSYAKAMKELDERKYAAALSDFRKADQQDGGHCVSC